MGNNSSASNSASHQQQCPSDNQEMGRGWTHSFPRELTRHHSQPPGHKVLPEPPNQRLRATNNGSIIHNGGTISGRRPSALTLPHDLNKGVYRSRSTSASNLAPRSRSNDQNQHNCCPRRSADSRCRDDEITELKRFGSEPDLRYSPIDHSRNNRRNDKNNSNAKSNNNNNRSCDNHQEHGVRSSYYPERECRERESRYRGKKKYKAPAPPAGEDSSPDSYKREIGNERENRCRPDEERTILKPPPRKSRLFKTRAETKKAQSNWQTFGVQAAGDVQDETIVDSSERRWRKEKSSMENRCDWRENSERRDENCWSRGDERRSKRYEGKNTLQRSLSSPEFQAELMQVARKVRDKLNYNGRIGPIGAAAAAAAASAATIISGRKDRRVKNLSREDSRTEDRKNVRSRTEEREDEARTEKRKQRIADDAFDERREKSRSSVRIYEERRKEACRDIENERTRGKNDRATTENSHRRRIVEKSYTYEERITSNGTSELVSGRKSHNERLEIIDNSSDGRTSSERIRREYDTSVDHRDVNEKGKNRKSDDIVDSTRTRSESPALRTFRDRTDVRGQGSGRESTPEPPRGKEKKNDHRKRRFETKDDNFVVNEKRWSSSCEKTSGDKSNVKMSDKNIAKQEVKETRGKNWNGLPPSGKPAPKTYYFSVDDGLSRDMRTREELQQVDHAQARLQGRDANSFLCNAENRGEEMKDDACMDDIALKLRPTLPKKQLEIPRFSPSAAWRLLSALETPGPTMSTASEEVPVMFEERIERLARHPPPLVALGPRSSHDKSGDSGISGDAGAANDDNLEVVTSSRVKRSSSGPAWTPQEDLGEESSSDAGVDSPPPPPPPASAKFPPRPHVFSLSLPRDDNRLSSNVDAKTLRDNSSFNSLQKLRRSVSGVLGLNSETIDDNKKRTGDCLNENWLLSTSAPNSLQHKKSPRNDNGENSFSTWENNYPSMDDNANEIDDNPDKRDFPMVMKTPSFSYLAAGGRVMYLPESNEAARSLNYRETSREISREKYRGDIAVASTRASKNIGTFGINGISINGETGKNRQVGIYRERSFTDLGARTKKHSNFFKSCDNITEMRQRSGSPMNNGPESLRDLQDHQEPCSKVTGKNHKGKRFTFQSTVRQIERRRLAEKLSREAEAKERQRKSELEVMRKVEEEFQRKRAREKANIRQQLRLYSMDENSSSLPPAWESSQLSRADPDGAPSSSASSPTSAPPGRMSNRKNSVESDDNRNKKRISETRSHQQQQQQQSTQQREYKDYRSKYYDWTPDSSSHPDVKQTTIHPKVVYDIPKSSHTFVDANLHAAKPANVVSTPRSDNYRKDFAHGAIAAKSSLASSDSELSQPNTRPHSRQNGNKNKPTRSRSASPARSDEAGSACEEESPVEAIKRERNSSTSDFILNGVQPFVREKSYRPIAFNPRPPPPPIPS